MSKIVRPQYFVSTDSIGFFGSSQQFIFLWKKYFDNNFLTGVEAIAFKPLNKTQTLIEDLKRYKISVVSFHGKTGGEELLDLFYRVSMLFINSKIIDTQILLKKFPEIEFLSHSPHFENHNIYKYIIYSHPKKIWVENHLYGKKGIDETIKQIVKFRNDNILADGMLDIYHYVCHEPSFLDNWSTIVYELKNYILQKDASDNQLFTGIHFPIGSRLNDSLPIDSMSDTMLELFAKNIIPHITRVVFENQQSGIGLIISSKKMLEKQRARNFRIIERLKKTGIII
jgi:hypothetical protein